MKRRAKSKYRSSTAGMGQRLMSGANSALEKACLWLILATYVFPWCKEKLSQISVPFASSSSVEAK